MKQGSSWVDPFADRRVGARRGRARRRRRRGHGERERPIGRLRHHRRRRDAARRDRAAARGSPGFEGAGPAPRGSCVGGLRPSSSRSRRPRSSAGSRSPTRRRERRCCMRWRSCSSRARARSGSPRPRRSWRARGGGRAGCPLQRRRGVRVRSQRRRRAARQDGHGDRRRDAAHRSRSVPRVDADTLLAATAAAEAGSSIRSPRRSSWRPGSAPSTCPGDRHRAEPDSGPSRRSTGVRSVSDGRGRCRPRCRCRSTDWPRRVEPRSPCGDGDPIGVVAVADRVKPEARDTVARLRRAGLQVAMVTGDHRATARAVAADAGYVACRPRSVPRARSRRSRSYSGPGIG